MKAKTTPISTEPHNFTHTGDEVLILRRVGQDRKAHNGFTYPAGVGSVVTAPDFNVEAKCGGGLHGWPWALGLGEGADYDMHADLWLILGAKPEDVVGELENGMKCKCRTATIRFEGKFKDAMDQLRGGQIACIRAMAAMPPDTKPSSGDSATNASSGHYAKNASSGDSATNASSGHYAKNASSGDSAKNASSGDSATNASSGDSAKNASSGHYAKNASSGDSATNASSGDSAKNASSGHSATNASSGDSAKNASSGHYAKNASSGDSATNASSGDSAKNASSGHYAKNASSGDSAKNASSGDSATNASAGNDSSIEANGSDSTAAIAGNNGKVKVSKRGAFALAFYDQKTGWDFLTGKVGVAGIKADTWYCVEAGKLVEVK